MTLLWTSSELYYRRYPLKNNLLCLSVNSDYIKGKSYDKIKYIVLQTSVA